MDRLAYLAQQHWRKYLPTAYASIEDPQAFFQTLSDEAQGQIEDLEESLRGPEQPATEPFADRMGRYRGGAPAGGGASDAGVPPAAGRGRPDSGAAGTGGRGARPGDGEPGCPAGTAAAEAARDAVATEFRPDSYSVSSAS